MQKGLKNSPRSSRLYMWTAPTAPPTISTAAGTGDHLLLGRECWGRPGLISKRFCSMLNLAMISALNRPGMKSKRNVKGASTTAYQRHPEVFLQAAIFIVVPAAVELPAGAGSFPGDGNLTAGIQIVDYDPQWSGLFEREAKRPVGFAAANSRLNMLIDIGSGLQLNPRLM